jgi:hypothetical protein
MLAVMATGTGTDATADTPGPSPPVTSGPRLGTAPLLDPRALRDELLDRGVPVDWWWGKPNGFRTTLGPDPGEGWVLMRKADYDALDKAYHGGAATGRYTLYLDDFENPAVEVPDLRAAGAWCLAPGREADPDAPFLVRLLDMRYQYRGRQIVRHTSPLSGINLLSRDGLRYDTDSTPITWATAFSRLWNYLPPGDVGLSATAPALPFTPHGNPEALNYDGWDAWAALNHFLTRLACGLRLDPLSTTSAGSWAVVRLGSADAAADAALAGLKPDRVWDAYPDRPNEVNRPAQATVYFRVYPQPPEPQVADAYLQTAVSLPAPAAGGAANPYGWDDIVQRTKPDGTLNTSDVAARAAERAADYARKFDNFDKPRKSTYRGFRKEAAACLGSTFYAAAWYDRGGGARTELYAGPELRLEEWRPPAAHPVPPAPVAWVVASGAPLSGNVHAGTAQVPFDIGATAQSAAAYPCYVGPAPTDAGVPPSAGAAAAGSRTLKAGKQYLAFYCGILTISGDCRPAYVVPVNEFDRRASGDQVTFETSLSLESQGSGATRQVRLNHTTTVKEFGKDQAGNYRELQTVSTTATNGPWVDVG